MRYLALIILIISGLEVHAQANQTHVTIDTKGHMGLVKNVMFSPEGDLLYSISDDKTVRVWDLNDGILVRTYRGYIEDNYVGMLNSGAISSDGNLIAVGGFLGNDNNTGDIRIHSAHTGELLAMLEGNKSSVVALQFSPDGNFLFSGANDGTIGIWNVNNQQGIKLDAHKNGAYGIAVSPDGKKFFTCAYDQKMIIWDFQKILDKGEVDYIEFEQKHTGEIRNCAWSPNGKHIVTVGFDNKINLWTSKGKFVKEIDHIMDPVYEDKYTVGDINCVAFSEDGSKIVIGTNLTNNENAIVYSIPDGEKLYAFTEHSNAVISCAWYGESTVATAGGNDREIYIWDANTGEVKHILKGNGKRMWKVAAGPGYSIGFGQEKAKRSRLNGFGELTGAYDLTTLDLIDKPKFRKYTSEVLDNGEISIDFSNKNPNIVTISNGNEIKVDDGVDGQLRCISLAPDGNIVVGCSYRTHMYDPTGKIIREFKGHSAEVYSLAFSEDGRFMYTASGDQTVKIWDLTDKGELKMTFEEFEEYITINYGADAVEKIGDEKMKELYGVGYDHNVVNAVASLFVSQDEEWILWTHDNHYATSQKGSRYVGFHINQGADKSAKYYAFEQFDVKFNRPDVVLKTLKTDTTGLSELFEKAYLKRLQKMGIDPAMLGDDIHAPELTLNTESQTTTKGYIQLSFLMNDDEEYLDRLFITNNDVPTTGKDGLSFLAMDSMQYIMYSMKEYLVPGNNRIQMWCTNTQGVRSARETVNIYYKSEKRTKPDLYILGLGASKYANEKMNLNYAAKDIDDFIKFYSGNAMYDSVHVAKLLNEEITLENINKSVSEMKKAEITDHVLVYIAGHGVLDANFDYFLATYDMDFNDPKGKGFAYTYLEEIIDQIPARTKTIFMDACHSGELDKEEVEFSEDDELADVGDLTFRSVGSAVKMKSGVGYNNSFHLMKNIFTDLRQSSGATVIASAGGAEYALEGDQWNNGVFTYALIDGLKTGEADLDKDGKIMLSETQKFLQLKVSELTYGRQKPISRYENISNDYVFWKVGN